MDIRLENKQFCLLVGENGIVKSLIHKASGQECLQEGEEMALCSVTQPRPFNNEVKLAHPNKRTTFQANRIRREGDRLIVGFEITPYEAVLEVKETAAYLSFRLADFIVHPTDYAGLCMSPPPVESFRLLQLPVKNRQNFGEWLNVSWDQDVAVNVLATSPYAQIDSERRKGCRILTADALREVKLKGTEAALIVTESEHLLDAIDRLEQDYNLPRGVRSRRSREIRNSIYWPCRVNPDNIDAHIARCKQGGFRMMTIYNDFLWGGWSTYGNYEFYPEYPEGLESVRKMVQKIRDAGIIPGFHMMHTHIGLNSRYVTPVADHRLHKTRLFTLARPLGTDDTTVYVEENPENAVMADGCRILQFGGELISYAGYTTERPYCFTGCGRGDHATLVTEHPLGQIGGILDVSEYCAISCYLDQNSSLQDEVAEKLTEVYKLGFEYVYFDGSEGTNEPFAFHVANAQYRVYQKLRPAPLLAEGAAKSHFGWHMLSGGNAFDVFPPAVFKEMIRRHPADEAPRMQQNFTRLNFGWWGMYPDLQPDHWEYGAAMAAAWDCPITIQADLEQMRSHPGTDDLLEILRRWEDVRVNGLLSDGQKRQIQENPMQEHILLINEARAYELVPYERILTSDPKLCAFAFERNGRSWAVCWHAEGNGLLRLQLEGAVVQKELYEAPSAPNETGLLPIGRRCYISAEVPREVLVQAFARAELLDAESLQRFGS